MAAKKSASKKPVAFKFVKLPAPAKPANGTPHMRIAPDDRSARKAKAKINRLPPKEAAALRGKVQRHSDELITATSHILAASTFISSYQEFVKTTTDSWGYGRANDTETKLVQVLDSIRSIQKDLGARIESLELRAGKPAKNLSTNGGAISQS